MLNDRRTAERWAASLVGKSDGPDKIRSRLTERGASPEDIEAALAGYDEVERRHAMARLIESRFKTPKDRARAGRLLLSRGFDEYEVESALSVHFGESGRA